MTLQRHNDCGKWVQLSDHTPLPPTPCGKRPNDMQLRDTGASVNESAHVYVAAAYAGVANYRSTAHWPRPRQASDRYWRGWNDVCATKWHMPLAMPRIRCDCVAHNCSCNWYVVHILASGWRRKGLWHTAKCLAHFASISILICPLNAINRTQTLVAEYLLVQFCLPLLEKPWYASAQRWQAMRLRVKAMSCRSVFVWRNCLFHCCWYCDKKCAYSHLVFIHCNCRVIATHNVAHKISWHNFEARQKQLSVACGPAARLACKYQHYQAVK